MPIKIPGLILNIVVLFHTCAFFGCTSHKFIPMRKSSGVSMGGSDFYRKVVSSNWKERDSVSVELIKSGNIPKFIQKFVRIRTSITDSVTGKKIYCEVAMVHQNIEVAGTQGFGEMKGYDDDRGNTTQAIENWVMWLGGQFDIIHGIGKVKLKTDEQDYKPSLI